MPTPTYLVVGVIPDGSASGFLGPATDLRIPRGSDAIVRLSMESQSGEPIDGSGAVGILTVRKKVGDAVPQLVRSATGVAGTSYLDFPFLSSETAFDDTFALVYDVFVIFSGAATAQAAWQGTWFPTRAVHLASDTPTVVPPAVPSLVSLPAQAGQGGKVLGTNGTALSWVAGGGGGGSSTDLNVLDFGAQGDAPQDGTGGGTDDTLAFQNALTALSQRKGGRLRVPAFKPDGTPCIYRVKGPLTFDNGGGNSYDQFEIDATGAIIWGDWGSAHQVWWTITNTWLWIRGLTLMGWNGSSPVVLPANQPFQVFALGGAELRITDALFSGIRLDQAPVGSNTTGGLIAGEASTLIIDEARFDSLVFTTITPIINMRHWKHVRITGAKGSDGWSWRNQSGSLGTGNCPGIVLGKPHYDTRAAPISRNGHAFIEQSNFDEGQGSVLVGGIVQTDGTVRDLVATLLASFTMPSYPASFPVTNGMTVTVNVSDTAWMETGDRVSVNGNWMQVLSVVDSTHVRLWNLDQSNTGGNGNVAAGQTVSASGSPLVLGQGPVGFLMEDCDMNHGQIGLPLVELHGVMHATIRNVFGREAGIALKARRCDSILVEGWETEYADAGQVRTVDVDATNKLVIFRDSDLDLTGAAAGQVIVDKVGARSLARYTNANKPAASAVPQGTAIWLTDLKKVYVSDGASWVDLSVSSGNDASSIQTTPVQAGAPVAGQVLQAFDSGGGVIKYHPATLPSVALPNASQLDWLANAVARGATSPSFSAGGYTTGSWWMFSAAGLITGMRFWWFAGAGSKTVRAKLWRANFAANSYTLLESQDIAVNAAGIYSVTFTGGGGAGGAHVVSGTDLWRRYAVTVWTTDGSVYSACTPSAITGKPTIPFAAQGGYQPVQMKPGMWMETAYTGSNAQADTAPEDANGTNAGVSSMTEPLFTLT